MTRIFHQILEYLERRIGFDSESPAKRRRKATFVVICALCILASMIWGMLYFFILGVSYPTFIPFIFTVVLGINLIIFIPIKRFTLLLNIFIIMILLNPIAMQWSLGGFAASGVLITWSILAPFSSLMLQNSRKATGWFIAFLILLGISLFFDAYVSQWALVFSNTITMLFFGINILGPAFIMFFSMMYFVTALQNEYRKSEKLLDNLTEEREKLAEMTAVLKKMFGRYLSTQVMTSLIENPSALELGGERRKVTIMMSDLRGFTAMSERLEPEQVVTLLNTYFEVMVEIIFKYHATINEFSGDGLLVIFGAPQEMRDRAQRAVACSIEMQNAMDEVNRRNRVQNLPELEMGIGLNDTEVIVGNIGSSRQSKYAVVGSGVNLTSRIESYTIGGQILVSESVRRESGNILRIESQRDVMPKGAQTPIRIYQVGGIAGTYNLALKEKDPNLISLIRIIPIRYTILAGKDIQGKGFKGSVIRLSRNCAEITMSEPSDILTNIKMNLGGVDERLSTYDFYGKIIRRTEENKKNHLVCFTSIPSEIDAYFQAHIQHASHQVSD